VRPDLGLPFDAIPEVTLLIEAATTVPEEALPGRTAAFRWWRRWSAVLVGMLDEGLITDAVVAQNESQRRRMWARREAAAEIGVGAEPGGRHRCLPAAGPGGTLPAGGGRGWVRLDPGHSAQTVGHLGDGNLHFTIFPSRDDAGLKDAVMETVEDVVQELGGSFSAEHGIGLSKLSSMRRRKDPVALDVMRAVKSALDPAGLMNPGKVIPAAG
jgi:FAD/FMN-containing dehydrogenase